MEHLDSTKKKIDSLESDVADKVTEISDTAKSMKNDDGSLIDEKFKDTVASADAVVQKYLDSTDSTTATTDKMNNIFALSQFSDLKDKLIAAGKSGGTDAIQKMIDDTDGLDTAMSNAGLTADDLAASIMSIADPDAKHLEGIKENLEDIFGTGSIRWEVVILIIMLAQHRQVELQTLPLNFLLQEHSLSQVE